MRQDLNSGIVPFLIPEAVHQMRKSLTSAVMGPCCLMAKRTSRLLQVLIVPRANEFEWRLLDQEEILARGLRNTREQAQRDGDSELFRALSVGL
jgi:hypothetical protein